jgi:DNA mismatch repair protein MSH3
MFLQLTHPLCDRHLICARHDAVSEIFESMGSHHSVSNLQDGGDRSCTASARSDLCTVLSSVLASLGRSVDIQRGITRVFHCKATAKEVKCVFFHFVLVDCKLNFSPFRVSLLHIILVTWYLYQ